MIAILAIGVFYGKPCRLREQVGVSEVGCYEVYVMWGREEEKRSVKETVPRNKNGYFYLFIYFNINHLIIFLLSFIITNYTVYLFCELWMCGTPVGILTENQHLSNYKYF